MSDKAAGWYPDPDGENRQRYWDGDSWSDYYTPLAAAPQEVHGAATASADYPYLANARGAAHHDVRIGATGGPAQRGWPTGAPLEVDEGRTQEFSGAGGRSHAGRWALVAASLLVAMLVVGVGWWALRGRGADPGGDPTSSGPPPSDGPTSTGSLAIGESTSADVAAGGLWVGTLSVDDAAVIVLDLRATGGAGHDPVLEVVVAGTDDVVAANDDRGPQLVGIGGGSLDPLLVAPLEPGEYEIRASERDGADLTFDVSAAAVTETVAIGTETSGTVPDDGGWYAVLEIPADGTYTVDVTAAGTTTPGGRADPVLVLLGPDGERLLNDDRAQDEYDPLLETDLTAGVWVILVTEYEGYGVDVDVTVTAA